jgi:flagellin-specific chaperone FliS
MERKLNYNLTYAEKLMTSDALEKYVEHLEDEGLKTHHEVITKFKKIITKLREGVNQ